MALSLRYLPHITINFKPNKISLRGFKNFFFSFRKYDSKINEIPVHNSKFSSKSFRIDNCLFCLLQFGKIIKNRRPELVYHGLFIFCVLQVGVKNPQKKINSRSISCTAQPSSPKERSLFTIPLKEMQLFATISLATIVAEHIYFRYKSLCNIGTIIS